MVLWGGGVGSCVVLVEAGDGAAKPQPEDAKRYEWNLNYSGPVPIIFSYVFCVSVRSSARLIVARISAGEHVRMACVAAPSLLIRTYDLTHFFA